MKVLTQRQQDKVLKQLSVMENALMVIIENSPHYRQYNLFDNQHAYGQHVACELTGLIGRIANLYKP